MVAKSWNESFIIPKASWDKHNTWHMIVYCLDRMVANIIEEVVEERLECHWDLTLGIH